MGHVARRVLRTATGSSVDRSDMAWLTTFKPVTDVCRPARMWLALIGSLLVATTLHARTMYISDTFEVVVRSEKQVGRNIVKILPTGTPVEVLEMDDSWATLQLSDGQVAYVLKRYLIDRLPYKLTAERLQNEVDRQKVRLDEVTARLTTLQDEHRRLKQESTKQASELTDITQKYEELEDGASQYLQLRENYEVLQRKHRQSEAEREKLKIENRNLKEGSKYFWLFSGAGIMLVGWIIGMITMRISGRRRRQGGYSLDLPQ